MKKSFSFSTRSDNINRLKSEYFDLVVVGGGINGAGIARDAASRGMKVAVIEAKDFAYGTSSRSSKLIHGGIRYLENFEFGLVYEALSERATLFEIAPHLVHPLRFVLPVYKGAKYGMFSMGLGMFAYDLLSLFESPYLHERLNKKETLQSLPMLASENLLGSFMYSDAYTDDDRLVIETLRSANDSGACAVNYVEVVAADKKEDQIYSLQCKDTISGENFRVKGKYFVSATGPWTDIFSDNVLKNPTKFLRPTKGIHITVARDRVPLKSAVVMTSEDQKRIIFGIPRKEMIVFGTTDTDYQEDPAQVVSETADVKYLLQVIGQHFPGINLKASDIIASYSGIRPLVNDGSSSEGKTSREHKVWQSLSNLSFVSGGKYTTYRLIAQEVVDHCLQFFPQADRMKFGISKTKQSLNDDCDKDSYNKAQVLAQSIIAKNNYKPTSIESLAYRHGMEAFDILNNYFVDEKSSLWEMEAMHAMENTMCFHLDDFYIRRTPLMLAHPGNGLEYLDSIADLFASHFNWNSDERNAQIAKVYQYFNTEMAWKNSIN